MRLWAALGFQFFDVSGRSHVFARAIHKLPSTLHRVARLPSGASGRPACVPNQSIGIQYDGDLRCDPDKEGDNRCRSSVNIPLSAVKFVPRLFQSMCHLLAVN